MEALINVTYTDFYDLQNANVACLNKFYTLEKWWSMNFILPCVSAIGLHTAYHTKHIWRLPDSHLQFHHLMNFNFYKIYFRHFGCSIYIWDLESLQLRFRIGYVAHLKSKPHELATNSVFFQFCFRVIRQMKRFLYCLFSFQKYLDLVTTQEFH